MEPQQIILVATAGCVCAAFTWGTIAHFTRPHGVPALLYVVATASTALTCAQIVRMTRVDPGWWTIPALAGYAAALALYLWAVATTRRHGFSLAFSADLPSALVARGPYQYVRHPFYVSYLLYWLAGAVAIREVWVIPAFAGVAALYVLAACTEERKFARSGVRDAYDDYRRRTGMFLPRLGGPR